MIPKQDHPPCVCPPAVESQWLGRRATKTRRRTTGLSGEIPGVRVTPGPNGSGKWFNYCIYNIVYIYIYNIYIYIYWILVFTQTLYQIGVLNMFSWCVQPSASKHRLSGLLEDLVSSVMCVFFLLNGVCSCLHINYLLLMDEILHHLGWLKPYKSWDNHHPWWCRILSIKSLSGGMARVDSTVRDHHDVWKIFEVVLPAATTKSDTHCEGSSGKWRGGFGAWFLDWGSVIGY